MAVDAQPAIPSTPDRKRQRQGARAGSLRVQRGYPCTQMKVLCLAWGYAFCLGKLSEALQIMQIQQLGAFGQALFGSDMAQIVIQQSLFKTAACAHRHLTQARLQTQGVRHALAHACAQFLR